MRTSTRYCLHYLLLASYAFVLSSAQFAAFGKLLNSGCESTITSESSKSQPFDCRPILTQWKHVLPALNTDTISACTGIDRFIVPSEQNEIVALPITYSTIISHFPYPPFWPRDPSLA